MAIDPATAKAIAQVAIKIAADEETRKKILYLILLALIPILLVLSLLTYILTNPIEELSRMFTGETLSQMVRIREQYTQLQYTEPTDICETDLNSKVLSDGGTPVVYYNQLDPRWRNIPYGLTGTIGSSGCGPTALAMVVSSQTQTQVNPIEVSQWACQNGYRCEGSGSYHSLIPDGGQHYHLNVQGCGKNDLEKVKKSLEKHKLVIAIMGPGHFTRNGHFIVLRGITEQGEILVADPASLERSQRAWLWETIDAEALSYSGAGGPYWIFSNEEK